MNAKIKEIKSPPKKKQKQVDVLASIHGAWAQNLLTNEDGAVVKKSIYNAIIILTNHPDTKEKLAFDTFRKKFMVLGALPHDNKSPRQLNDHDATMLTGWLEVQGLTVSVNTTLKAMQAVSHANQFDPLTEYLNSIEWDGKKRVDSWLSDYLGVDKTSYTENVGRCFLVGSVARALRPGCKNDTMLILEGEQGAQKSTALETLFGSEFFTDEIAKLGSKDAGMQAQGVWCVEASELAGMSKAKEDDIKAFLSRSVDRFRAPYAYFVDDHHRRSVLAGTVNPDGAGYLKDTTGGRRFWPVGVKTILIELLKKDRDQLWAEAKVLFDGGAKWWLNPDQEAEAKLAQEERKPEDPWLEPIVDWLSQPINEPHRFSTTSGAIMTHCLGIPLERHTAQAKKKVAQILVSQLGYELTWPKDKKRNTVRTYVKK